MDHAVSLVQAYLHVNGYFTVAEYPVLEPMDTGGIRTASDIDLLALRLCEARWLDVGDPPDRVLPESDPDPALEVPAGAADFLICEVKEGRAELNRGAKSPAVLTSALSRFGLTRHPDLARALEQLREQGRTRWPDGTWVRMLAFGSYIDPRVVQGFQAISLGAVVAYLEDYLARGWPVIRHAQIRHPALGLLALLEQVRRQPRPAEDPNSGART